MTIKQYIKNYVMMKIQAKDWIEGAVIDSENKLSNKFNCSRITVRGALQELVNNGYLIAKKGKGYIVRNNTNNFHLQPFNKEFNTDKAEIIVLDVVPEDITEELKLSDDNVFSFIKKYFRKGKLIAVQFTALNKNVIWKTSIEGLGKSITTELSKQGIIIQTNEYEISFKEHFSVFEEYLNKLGYEQMPLVEKVGSYTSYDWVEKTIRVIKKDEFKYHFQKSRMV